jgi:hypothetical protein
MPKDPVQELQACPKTSPGIEALRENLKTAACCRGKCPRGFDPRGILQIKLSYEGDRRQKRRAPSGRSGSNPRQRPHFGLTLNENELLRERRLQLRLKLAERTQTAGLSAPTGVMYCVLRDHAIGPEKTRIFLHSEPNYRG